MNIEDIKKLTDCYTKKCKKEAESRKKIRAVWFENSNKIYNNYINKKITREEFIEQINKLDSKYFNSIESIAIHKCEINKCYNLLKKKLDYTANKIDYIKKNKKYTIDDYINILTITNKNNNNEIK